MINKFLCLTLCLFLARCLYGQRDAQIIHDDIRKFPFRVLTLSDPGEHIRLNNVRSILVVDARPDTLPVGLMQEEHPRAFMGFKKNVRETLNRFLSLYLQPNNLDSLPQVVMVLRKFWISDELSDQVNRLNSIKDDSSRFYRGIVEKIEFYLQRQSDYYPLYRFDSTISDQLELRTKGRGYVEDGLIAALSRLSELDKNGFAGVGSRNKLKWEEIAAFNRQNDGLPVFTDSALRRGVYLRFDEFKNNRPAAANYRIVHDQFNDLLYIQGADGKETLTRNVWGYCDGRHAFIKTADLYFMMQQINHSFYFYGVRNLSHIEMNAQHPGSTDPLYQAMPGVAGDAGTFNTIMQRHYKMSYRLFQLDLDNGRIY